MKKSHATLLTIVFVGITALSLIGLTVYSAVTDKPEHNQATKHKTDNQNKPQKVINSEPLTVSLANGHFELKHNVTQNDKGATVKPSDIKIYSQRDGVKQDITKYGHAHGTQPLVWEVNASSPEVLENTIGQHVTYTITFEDGTKKSFDRPVKYIKGNG